MPIQNVVYQIDFDDAKAQAAFNKMRQTIAKANKDFEDFIKTSKKPTGDSVDKLADNLENADDKTRRAAKGLDLLAASLAGVQNETEDIDSKQIEELGNAADKTAEKIKKIGKAKKDADLGKDAPDAKSKTEKLSKEELQQEKEANKKLEQQKQNKTLSGKLSNFKNATDSASDFKEKIATGDIAGATDAVKDFGGSLKGAFSSGNLIAAAAVVSVGAIAAISVSASEGADKIKEYKKQISELTSFKGADAANVAIDVAAFAKTFGADAEKTINAINQLVVNRGVSVKDASAILQDQLSRGLSDEGLQQFNEYDIQLKEIGLTAVESFDFIRESIKAGFYDDKAIDALKETQIKLSEFSQSAVDALKPLGAEFNKTLISDLKSGQKTAFQVFTDISKQATKVGLTRQQLQLLVADVLGGSPGEDAGRDKLIAFLNDFSDKMGKARAEKDASQQASSDLADAEKDLQREYERFGTVFTSTGNTFKIFFIKLQTYLTSNLNYIGEWLGKAGQFFSAIGQFFADVYNPIEKFFVDTYNVVQNFFTETGGTFDKFLILIEPILVVFRSTFNLFVEYFTQLSKYVLSSFNTIGEAFTSLGSLFVSIGSKVGDFFTFIGTKISDVFSTIGSAFSKFFSFVEDLIQSVFPKFSFALLTVENAINVVGIAFSNLLFPIRAVIATLTLGIKALSLFKNEALKLSNSFLGTKFEIDPKINTESFAKEFEKFKASGEKGFLEEQKKLSTQPKTAAKPITKTDEKKGATPPPKKNDNTPDSNQKKPGFTAAPQLSGGGSKDKEKPFEVKIEANTKPFDDAIAKVKDDILKLEQDALIATIQFNFEIEKETLPVAQEFAAQFENDFQKRKSTIQLQNEIETINKTTQLRKETAQEELTTKFETEKDRIRADIDNEAERQKQTKILYTKFETELVQIDDKFQKEKAANSRLISKKESDFIEQTERAAILVRLKTIKILKDQVEKELFTNTVNTLNFTTKLSENTTNFDAQRRNVTSSKDLKAGQAKKEEIDSLITFNNTLLKIDEEIAVERQKIANATDQETKDKALKAIETLGKQKELLTEKQALNQKNAALASIELNIETANKLSEIDQKQLDEKQRVVNQEKAILEEGIKNATVAVDKINEIASKLYSNDKTSFSAGALSAISGVTSGVNQTVDLFKNRRNALDNQADRQKELKDAKKLQAEIDTKKGEQQSIINNSDESKDRRDKAKESLAELENQSNDVNKNIADIEANLKKLEDLDFKELIKNIASLAESLNNSIFQVLQEVSQATVNELDKNIAKQKEQISTIENALKEGGDAAKNYSVEQLEAERERLKATEELRKAELQKQNDYMIAQLVINGAIAVSQTFATVPFPFNIVAAALVIASLVAQIAVVRSQMRAQKAEKGIIGIGEKDKPKGGKLQGARHSEGGILIEAEGGESILTRNATRKYWAIAEGMNNGNLTEETVLKHFPAIGFEKERLALETKKVLLANPPKIKIPEMGFLKDFRASLKLPKETSISHVAKIIREIHQENIHLTVNNNSDFGQLKSELNDIKNSLSSISGNIQNLGKTEVHLNENGIYSIHNKIAHRKDRIRNHK